MGRKIELGLNRWTQAMMTSFQKKYDIAVPLNDYPFWKDFLTEMKALSLANYIEGFMHDILDFLWPFTIKLLLTIIIINCFNSVHHPVFWLAVNNTV